MFDKMDRNFIPSKEDMINIVRNDNCARLKEICEFIENELNGKHRIDYSVCSYAPGWNLKYKKSGKPVCVVYPEKDKFIILITLNFDAAERFKILSGSFSPYIADLVNNTDFFNGSKWLMVNVENESSAQDAVKLMKIKFDNNKN